MAIDDTGPVPMTIVPETSPSANVETTSAVSKVNKSLFRTRSPSSSAGVRLICSIVLAVAESYSTISSGFPSSR